MDNRPTPPPPRSKWLLPNTSGITKRSPWIFTPSQDGSTARLDKTQKTDKPQQERQCDEHAAFFLFLLKIFFLLVFFSFLLFFFSPLCYILCLFQWSHCKICSSNSPELQTITTRTKCKKMDMLTTQVHLLKRHFYPPAPPPPNLKKKRVVKVTNQVHHKIRHT